ncbi:MAG: hypothetical protein AB7S26_30240 [Sandaracinaceae bacterium]
MNRSSIPLVLVLLALGATACSDSHENDAGGITFADSGPRADAGPSVVVDAGPAATDAGPSTFDAGPPADLDAGGPRDAGDTMGIDCMGMTCDSTTEQCCIVANGMGAMASCIAATDMCMGAMVTCDGPEDCAGNVCCARASLAGIDVMCDPDPSTCGMGGFGEFELCHVASDCRNGTDMCCAIMRFGLSASVCRPTCGGF